MISLRTFRYIFAELIPVFLLGILVFVFILLMFQALRLTEFVLVHGVAPEVIARLMGYMSISFLPAILPMSLLFSVLMTYGRLSNDSEIIALKSVGIGMFQIIFPALLFGTIVTVVSAKTSFELAPWGNRQFEVLVNDIGSKRAAITIREGTFSEGFFDLVIYANKVESKTGQLKQVFIYDERQKNLPITIIAQRGQIITDPDAPGHFALLRLQEGSIHRKTESHVRIQFDSYDIQLSKPLRKEEKRKSLSSLSLNEIDAKLDGQKLPAEEQRKLSSEYHKRIAISIACLVFAMVGAGFGAVTNKRAAKSGGFILSIVLVVFYWIFYVSLENAVRQGQIEGAQILWLPNIVYGLIGIYMLRKNWN